MEAFTLQITVMAVWHPSYSTKTGTLPVSSA
jgi:hypothetical protein